VGWQIEVPPELPDVDGVVMDDSSEPWYQVFMIIWRCQYKMTVDDVPNSPIIQSIILDVQ